MTKTAGTKNPPGRPPGEPKREKQAAVFIDRGLFEAMQAAGTQFGFSGQKVSELILADVFTTDDKQARADEVKARLANAIKKLTS